MMEPEVSRLHSGFPITLILDQLSPGISTATGKSISQLQIETAAVCRFILVMVWEPSLRLAFSVLVPRHSFSSQTAHFRSPQRILTVTTNWTWLRQILRARV